MAVSVSACTIPCMSSKSNPLAAASSSTSSSLLRLRPLPIGRTTSTCLSRPRLLPLVKAKQQTFSSFDDLLENSDKPVLVDFYATWCGPCQFMAPILNEVSTQLKDKIQVVKIDTEKYPSLADKYRIEALPTFIIFKDGEPYDRFVALSNPDWRQAIQLQTATLHLNGAWDLVPLPLGKHTVGCKWVYTVKFHLNDWLKAWLLAKEYTQAYGIDYDEMLYLEAKISAVQVMISLMANLDWTLYQFDVNNAFIHGDLLEELYME